jgi:glycosyltransferase involved in cell wall biosynthesis
MKQPTSSGPRICILTEAFPPETLGGQEIHGHALAEHLLARGLAVQVVTRRFHADAPARELVGNVPVVRIGAAGLLKGRGWRALGPLLSFLAGASPWLFTHRRQYDVLLVFGVKVLPALALLTRLMPSKRRVFKAESPMELWQPISAQSLARMRLAADGSVMRGLTAVRTLVLRSADRHIAISGEIRDELLKLGVPNERITMIPNGIDLTRFRPVPEDQKRQLRVRLGLPVHRVVLVFVGRLAEGKGVLTLLRIWSELIRERPSLHLVMIGRGSDSFDDCETEVRAFVDAHALGACTTLPGAVDNVQAYLQAADLFVFPSEYEGFGLALVEAMACGLPVVSTEVGVAADAIGDGIAGRLVPAKAPEQFRQALEWMIDRPERWAAMGQAGRQRVAVRYGMDAVADRYVALLRSLQLPSENSAAEPVDTDGPTAGGATRPTAGRGR